MRSSGKAPDSIETTGNCTALDGDDSGINDTIRIVLRKLGIDLSGTGTESS